MKYRNYFNWESGRRKIYSDEDLLKMTLKEIIEHENELAYQHNTIGLPSEEELLNSSYGEQYQADHGMYNYEDKMQAPQTKTQDLPGNLWNIKSYLSGIKPLDITDNGIVPNSYNKSNEGFVLNDQQEFEQNKALSEPAEYQLQGQVVKTNLPFIDRTVDTARKYEDLDGMSAVQKAASKLPINVIEREYYGLQSHLNDGEKIPERVLKENNIFKYGEIEDRQKAQKYKKDLAKMYGFNPNDPNIEELLKNKVIVEPKSDSRISKYIKNSDEMQQWIADNYERLKSGDIREGESINFPMGKMLDIAKNGLHLTIGKSAIKNIKFNEDGSMSYELRDPDDYEYQEKTGDYGNDIVKDINNRAYKQQEAGQLENILFNIPQELTKEELEEIIKKYRKLKYN